MSRLPVFSVVLVARPLTLLLSLCLGLRRFVRNVFSVLFNAVKNEDKFKAITSILFLRLLIPGMVSRAFPGVAKRR